MINNDTLNNLYNGVIEEQELTTKELNSYGFNSKDLADLINDNVLKRFKRGYYTFLDVENLYYYGKKLISIREYDNAVICFEKCHELNPKYNNASFQLFFRKIKEKDYEKAFEYFDNFYNSQNNYYENDSNFYLYLLNSITDIPEHHQDFAKFIKFDDIKVDSNDKRYIDAYYENRMRSLALNKKFGSAIKELNNFTRKKGKLSIQDIVTKELLVQALEIMDNNKKMILYFLNEKKHDDLIEYLEKLDKKNCLSQADLSVLQLARDYKSIKETNIIPIRKEFSTDKLFKAIEFKNYDLALTLCSNGQSKINLPNEENAIYILLNEIKKEEEKIEPKRDFFKLTESLLNQDLDNVFILLKSYLNKIGKTEYEFLVVNMIKLGVLEKDNSFSKTMITLNNISNENYTFDVLEYMQEFYFSLSQCKFDCARIYFDILSNSNKLSEQDNIKENLKQILDTTEKMFNHTNGNKEIIDDIKQSKGNILPKEKEIKNAIKSDTVNKKSTFKNNNIEEKRRDETNNFIKQKVEELYRCGMLLLKPMTAERRKIIHSIIEDIPDVVSFEIGKDRTRQIVLRFKPYTNEEIDVVQLSEEGKKAYEMGDYNTCIDKDRQVLEYGEPSASVYGKLGLAYMKKWNKKRAIEYFTVATYLSKEEQSDNDFSELIEKLKGIENFEDKKPRVKMEESDFCNDIDDYYGIECIDEISNLLHLGFSLDEACSQLNLNEEQHQLVSLICAKECYAIENYSLGDKYIKKVEKSKNKGKNINHLMYKLKKNKKFYKNRTSPEEQKKLVLIPYKKSTN